MSVVEDRLEIAASIDEVWALTLDVESWPKITPTMTEIVRLDAAPLGLGSKVRIKQPGQRARVWTVTEFDVSSENQRRFGWSTKALGVNMTGTHELLASTTGTVNILTIDLEGRAAGLIGTLLKGPLSNALATENHGFKTAAEAPSTRR